MYHILKRKSINILSNLKIMLDNGRHICYSLGVLKMNFRYLKRRRWKREEILFGVDSTGIGRGCGRIAVPVLVQGDLTLLSGQPNCDECR